MKELLYNEYVVWCIMAIIVFAMTQICKLPIKYFTKRIKNERKRKIANATILLIPFILGVLLEFLYSTYVLKSTFSVISGLAYGTAGISFYGVVERFFKIKTVNPYETQEGQAVTGLIKDVTNDGKIDYEDIDAVKSFLEKVNKK